MFLRLEELHSAEVLMQQASGTQHRLPLVPGEPHLTYLLKSGCTKIRCGHKRLPMYPGIAERMPNFRASSAEQAHNSDQ